MCFNFRLVAFNFRRVVFLSFFFFSESTDSHCKTYIFVSTQMNWEDARSHCRQHYTDLAMIEDKSENSAVASITSSLQAWIGLYRKPWRWSDGSTSTFTRWLDGQPNNYDLKEYCIEEHDYFQWNDEDCSVLCAFICEKGEEILPIN